ncbi:acyltransferase family protein [Geomesophilobacter sediminis]|uniref:Acyltransferase n=1 Tax=Geomesophilobacter sediminis TaxID=2798584 RepID=A0A8J7M2Y2_9BACT|nr:acyltransferase [Geomesophilobacter sediminis]MBJ6727308.1 acyltransferase [Geomesophilobacter sediminis]
MGKISQERAAAPRGKWAAWLVRHASRETSSGQFIPVIDGLRFIAIFSVVLFHVYTFVSRKNPAEVDADPLAAVLMTGDLGVQLFFVISGFIIALPFARGYLGQATRPTLRSYYLRRLTRLEPPYILSLLLLFPFSASVIHLSYRELLPHLAASLGYLHSQIYAQMSAVNFVAWSLEVELQFYVLAPLIAAVFLIRSRWPRRSLLLGLIALFAVISYRMPDTPRLTLSIVASAHFFLTGFLLVDLYLGEWRDGIVKSYRWDLVSALAWPAVFLLHAQGKTGNLFVAAPMFLAYYCAFRGTWSNRFFSRPAIYIVGGMCYTLYLYHYPVIFIVGRILERAGLLPGLPVGVRLVVLAAAALPAVLGVGCALFALVEKPCMRKEWYLKVAGKMKEWFSWGRAGSPTDAL